MELLPGFSGCRTPGVCAGEILVDPRPEDDEYKDAMGEVDNMEDGIVADAAVKDDIGGQFSYWITVALVLLCTISAIHMTVQSMYRSARMRMGACTNWGTQE
jgi:hypothetical protein